MNKDNLNLFWAFIAERHAVWYRRNVLNQDPPWTEDTVLGSYHFTNVYRQLDPGTVYAETMLRTARSEGEPTGELVFNALAYRLAFHEGSKAALGWLPIGAQFTQDSGAYRRILRDYDHPFTPAYVVSNYGRKGTKVDVIMDVLGDIAVALAAPPWPERLLEAGSGMLTRHATIEAFRSLFGIGPFVAFQAVVDLTYPVVGVLPGGNDGYALAGPGARKGLALLGLGTTGDDECDESIAWLTDAQGEGLGYMEDFYGMEVGGEPQYIDRSDMQNCCCEFSKYVKAVLSTGRLRRRFDPAASRLADRERRGYLKQLEMEGMGP